MSALSANTTTGKSFGRQGARLSPANSPQMGNVCPPCCNETAVPDMSGACVYLGQMGGGRGEGHKRCSVCLKSFGFSGHSSDLNWSRYQYSRVRDDARRCKHCIKARHTRKNKRKICSFSGCTEVMAVKLQRAHVFHTFLFTHDSFFFPL